MLRMRRMRNQGPEHARFSQEAGAGRISWMMSPGVLQICSFRTDVGVQNSGCPALAACSSRVMIESQCMEIAILLQQAERPWWCSPTCMYIHVGHSQALSITVADVDLEDAYSGLAESVFRINIRLPCICSAAWLYKDILTEIGLLEHVSTTMLHNHMLGIKPYRHAEHSRAWHMLLARVSDVYWFGPQQCLRSFTCSSLDTTD